MAFDLQTQLSKFLADLYAGTLGVTLPITQIQAGDGTVTLPTYSYLGQTGLGFYRNATDQLVMASGGVKAILFQDGVGLRFRAANVIQWNSSGSDATAGGDSAISRLGAASLAIGSGAAADFTGSLKLTTLNSVGAVSAFSATAVPAGGTAGSGFTFSSTANLGVFFGSGAPTLSAAQGSLYINTTGNSTSTRAYVNTNGATTWTAITTVA